MRELMEIERARRLVTFREDGTNAEKAKANEDLVLHRWRDTIARACAARLVDDRAAAAYLLRLAGKQREVFAITARMNRSVA